MGEAGRLEWDVIQAKPDLRRDYGEDRQIGYAPMEGRIYCVVFVERDEGKRIKTYEDQA